MPTTVARRIVAQSRYLLLDFDGPICSIFAGRSAASIARELHDLVTQAGTPLGDSADSVTDPLEMLRLVGRVAPELVGQAELFLRSAELDSTMTAEPTPHIHAVLEAARKTERPIAIVSNNATAAVANYLDMHSLRHYFSALVGRDSTDPLRMKPDPYLVQRAITDLDAEPSLCLMVGDSPSDIVAAIQTGARAVGFANKNGKAVTLAEAGAAFTVSTMAELAEALAARA